MEACESWRVKGNEAYERGDMIKAEECYTEGVNCVPRRVREALLTSGSCCESLVLCYQGRADVRIRREKIREALRDCEAAAGIDPHFLKLHMTSANCYLQLGELEAAVECLSKFRESGDYVCLDRRIILDAAEELQKAQRVEEYTKQAEELIQHRTKDSAAIALSVIDEALSISSYSEKLLELKGKALVALYKYEKVIQLCEKTLDFAEKNFPMVSVVASADGSQCKKQTSVRLWRLRLMSKAYFHLGKLEKTLDLLKEQDLLRHRSNIQGSSMLFSITVRDILRHKNAGDEAFNAERYTEAVEHYTAALSRSTGSRPVTAVCFCNRAAAYIHLDRITDAIADCNLAIALYGNYKEAIFFRAASFISIRDCGQAATDVTRLLSLLQTQPEDNVELSTVVDVSSCCNVEELQETLDVLMSPEAVSETGGFLDVYMILGAKQSDTSAEIKKSFREAALRHHPDKVVGRFLAESGDIGQLRHEISDEIRKSADMLFKMIAEAYDVLSDPTKRSAYDLHEEKRKAEEGEGSQDSD